MAYPAGYGRPSLRMTLLSFGGRLTPNGNSLSCGLWRAVFEHRHDFDAHAWPYVQLDSDGEVIDPQVRVGSQGGKPTCTGKILCGMAFLDYDKSNDHAQIFETFFEKVPDDHPLRRFAAMHVTKSGIRLVYRLEQPVLHSDYGPLVRGLAHELWRLTGMQVDPTTDQWFRCFRLPMVVREDGKANGPSWEQPWFFPPLISDSTIAANEVRPLSGKLAWDSHKQKQVAEAGQTPEAVDLDGSRMRWFHKALPKTWRFHDVVFDGRQIPRGHRDPTLLAVISEMVKRCFTSVPMCKPDEILELLLPLLNGLEEDGGEPWDQKAWRLIQHCWDGEVKKAQQIEEKKQKDLSLRSQLVERLLEALPAGRAPNDPEEREALAMRMLALQTRSGFYVVTETGRYSCRPIGKAQLPAHFHGPLACLDPVAGFRSETGEIRGADYFANNHSINIGTVRLRAGKKAEARLFFEGDQPTLEVVPFMIRPDLYETAQRDKEIESWLRCFKDHNLLEDWLASAVAIEHGPTASCFLHGPAAVGKTMISKALAEVWDSEPTPGAEAFADFNWGLSTSPVVVVDEGLPRRRNSGLDAADIFRQLVTGGPVSVNGKFMQPLVSHLPYRVIFAANSFDLVKHLIGDRTLNENDQEALIERVLVIETGDAPARHLAALGGMNHTRFSSKGSWVGGECRLARHILALYKERFESNPTRRDGRMLVAGRTNNRLAVTFLLSGGGRRIVEDLCTDLLALQAGSRAASKTVADNMRITAEGAFVKKRGYMKVLATRNTINPNQDTGEKTFERFLRMEIRRQDDTSNEDWIQISMPRVMACAEHEGIRTDALRRIYIAETSCSK